MLEEDNSISQEDSNRPDQHKLICLKADLDMYKRLLDMELTNLKTRMDSIVEAGKTQHEELDRVVKETREKVTDAMHISIGVDGRNGLRGTMETVKAELSAISRDLDFLRQAAHSYNSTKQLFTRLFTSTALAIFIQLMGAIWFVSAMHSKQDALRDDLNRVLMYIDKQQQRYEPAKSFPTK
jgi:hypothetical protein